jgi:anti-sigma factor RsiW
MTACPDKEPLLGALIDGELDAANVQALETHLKTCPGCAQHLARLQALHAQLADPGVAPPAPESLRRRVLADLDREDRGGRRLAAVLPWTVSGVTTALAASLALVVMVRPGADALEDQLVADHVRSTLASHLVDVQTSDRHTVKPWFNGKLDFAPPVLDLQPEGYPLVGGRLDYAQGRTIAALVYGRGKHVINLFVWPQDKGLRLPVLGRSREGYHVVRWERGGLQFWAVSDVDPHDLEGFSQAYRDRTPS